MICPQCSERDVTVYLVTPGAKPRSQEERHLCQPCFEEVFHHRPDVLNCLRKGVADAGASSGWTSYTPGFLCEN